MNRIVFGCAAVCAAFAAGAKVELTLEFAPGADVASDLASVRFAPLKDNRAFAFTTRWDDTHKSGPAVAQVLREYGIPGTFYHVSVSQGLIDGILGPRQEIGSHTSTHCSVGMSSGNTSFLEMMGNRCDLECAAQRPVLSFVLPGCVYWDPFWTGSGQKLLGEAIRRVGFTSSPEFAGDKLREKYGFSTNEFVVSYLFCPDDRKNWPEKFESGVSNALEQIRRGKLREPIVTQGVHPWLDAEGFRNLRTNMASIARNADAWFCTQTEYAAYRRQLASARILSAHPTASGRAVVTLDLPPRGAAGADVPLTLLLPPSVRAVNGAAVTNGLASVSLPGPSHVPASIDQVVNADNAPGEPIAAKRLPLAARLSIDVTQNVARLVVRNASAGRQRLAPRLRLPPRWRTGVVALDECELAPDGTRTWTCGLGALDTRAELVGGRILAAAEVEVFDADARCSRLWVRTAFVLPKAYPDRGELPIYFTGTGTNAVHLVKVDKPGDYRLWAYCGKQGFTSVRVNGASVKLTPYCPSAPVRLQAGENRIELCYRSGKNGKTWYAFALTHPKGDPRFEFLELSRTCAAAAGKQLSDDYRMTVDGRDCEVVRVPMPEASAGCIKDRAAWQPYSYASFVATAAVEVVVRSEAFDLSKAEILPASKRVVATRRTPDTIAFAMAPQTTLVLEPRGRHRALVISSNRPEADPPKADDPKVRYFGPGFRRVGLISLGDGETLYLAPGAWVEGFVRGRGRDITICGSGVLSGACWSWHKGPPGSQSFNVSGTLVTLSGENVSVRDTTFFSSWGWTLVMNGVTNALVDNVKVIGGRVINDDGIDICRARDVTVRNSFVRCQDDCVTPKYWCENLVCSNMVVWTDAANAFRSGYECESGASGLVYRNLLFKDIDVLHLSLNKTSPRDYWANCAIYIQPANDQPIEGSVYEDIRFHEVGPRDIFLNVKTMPITQGSPFCRTDRAGVLRGLTLRNIHLPDSQGGMCVNLSAYDDAHPIEGVRFESVTGYGKVTTSGRVDFLK